MDFSAKDTRVIRYCVIVAALAAVAYAAIGQLWLVVAHREMEANGGRLLLEASGFAALKSAVGLVVLAGGAAAAWLAHRRWAVATVATTLGGILGGVVLYRVAERLWWPEFSFGCTSHRIANGYFDGVCLGPLPIYFVGTPGDYFIYAGLILSAVAAALLAGWVVKRIGAYRLTTAEPNTKSG